MFYWFIYILSSFLVSYIFSKFFSVKIQSFIFFLVLALLITPENLGIGSQKPSPAVSSFFFDLIFEQSISGLTLRPLVISLPLAFTLSLFVLKFKKRFSQN
jgi:hypothetical protein